jgi:peptidoglycan hydrolase-like protein with peptidoglycan-binding domain
VEHILPSWWDGACYNDDIVTEGFIVAEPILRKGSTDPAVKDLQDALKVLGHDPGSIDGVFGGRTESAVKAFQQQREITVDGIVGRVTWINIDEADQSEPVLRVGSIGLPVRRLQSRMSAVGFDTGGVDGRFSTKTEQAVKQLQQQANLVTDGIVGPRTWAVVAALENEGGAS